MTIEADKSDEFDKNNEQKNNEQNNSNPGEYLILIFILIAGIAFFSEAINLKGIIQGETSGMGAFPQIITSIIISLTLLEIIKLYRSNYKQGKFSDLIAYVFSKEVVVLIVLVISYALFLQKLGFTIATFLFLFITMLVFDRSQVLKKLIITLLVLFVVTVIFKEIFNVLLP